MTTSINANSHHAQKQRNYFLPGINQFLNRGKGKTDVAFEGIRNNPFNKFSSYFVSVLSLFCFLVASNAVKAQTAYDCNNCSAGDVSISNVQLVSTTLNPAYQPDPLLPNVNYEKYLPLSTSCIAGQPVSAFLKITVDQNAQERYGLHVEGNINVDGILSTSFSACDPNIFKSGGRDKFYVDASPISWTCGTVLTLDRTFVGWGENIDKNACEDICKIGPHCNKPDASVTFTVITPLSANFTFLGSCPTSNTAQSFYFNALASIGGTTGGTSPYASYHWTIKNSSDVIVAQTDVPNNVLVGSNPTYNFSTLGAGTYRITLTVTDDNPTATSTKWYDIAVASCCTDPNAGINGTLSVCAGTTPTDAQLFAQLGGTPDPNGSWSNVGNVYTYTVLATAPCTNNATATVTVSTQAQPNAGINGTLSVCAGTTPTDAQLFAQLGGTPDPNGSWSNVGNVYTYTVLATAPCTNNATATVTVSTQAQPNAGTNGTLSVCAGTTPTDAQLFAQLGGTPDPNGSWSNVGNVYTYTVLATAPCTNNATATVTVSTQAQPNAGINGTLSVCAGTTPTDAQLFAQLGGTPDPNGSWSNVGNVYTYTVLATAPCTNNATATVTVSTQAQPNAGTNGTLSVCAGTTPTDAQLFAQLGGTPDPNGSWSNVGNVYTYTVLATAPCTNNATATVTVSTQAQPNAGTNGTLSVCAGTTPTDAQLFAQLGGTPDPNGSWSNVGNVYTYTVLATAPCTNNATATVTVSTQAQPNAGTNGTLSVCAGTTPTDAQLFAQLGGTPDPNGSWSNVGNVYTYTVTPTLPCTVNSTATVTVTFDPLPTATAGGSATICANGSNQVSGASASYGTISWSENGAGSITLGATTLTPTYTAAAGDAGNTVTLTMTVTSNNSCGTAIATATYTVTVTALPSVTNLSNVIISYPANATFSSTISGTTTSAAYWKDKIGASFTSLSNSAPYAITTLPTIASTSPTSSSLTITSPPVSWSGRNYQLNVDGCGITANSIASLTVNAAPLCLTYDGLTFGVTNTSKCYVENNGKIKIILTVVGTPVGDISTAVVKVSITGSISNATATYVAASGGNPAYFYYDWTVPCPAMTNTANSSEYEVSWTIGGNYTGAACNETVALITISAPSQDFTTGGGYIFNNNSRGTIGLLNNDGTPKNPLEAPAKNNYGFNLKWGNNLKNLQGNFNTIIRQGGMQYQVKTNKPTYLSTKALPSYTINGKTYYPYEAVMVYENATFKNLTTGTGQGGGPNSVVYLRVEDNGEPNTAGTQRIDRISILYKLNNVVIYSSEAYTVTNNPAVINLMDIVKGNIQVHVQGAKTGAQPVAPDLMVMAQASKFELKALPNPSSSSFNVLISGEGTEKMQVRVMDILGRTVQSFNNLHDTQTLKVGADYKPGVYFVELIQGTSRKQIKLVKL